MRLLKRNKKPKTGDSASKCTTDLVRNLYVEK